MKKIYKIKLILKNSFYRYYKNEELNLTISSQIITLISGFMVVKLISHYASIEEYGLYSLALSIAAFVSLYPFSAFDQAIARYISIFHNKSQYAINFTSILLLYTIMVLVLLLFYFLLYWNYTYYFSRDIEKILYSLTLFCILNIFKTTLLHIENYNRNKILVMYSKIFEGLVKLIILAFVVSNTFISANIILWINIFVFIWNIVFLIVYNKNNIVSEGLSIVLLKKNFLKFFFFASPLLLWAVFSWAQFYIPLWFLNHYWSTEEVGHFSMLNTLGTIIPTQIVGIIGSYITPIMYQKETMYVGYIDRTTSKLVKFLSIVFIILGLMMWWCDTIIILILSSPQYLQYSNMLPFLYLAACFSNIAVIWTYKFFAYKETKKLLYPQIVPAIIGLIAGNFLIPSHGVIGAMYTTLIIALSYFILLALWYSAYHPKPL